LAGDAYRDSVNISGQRMNAVEIEKAVSRLAEASFDSEEFPFAFLEAFGKSPPPSSGSKAVARTSQTCLVVCSSATTFT